MGNDSFYKNMVVDKETVKKWVQKGFDVASDFNNDFATTSKEREKNEKILQKSRDWVGRMYGVIENYNEVEIDTDTNMDSSSLLSKQGIDDNNPTKEMPKEELKKTNSLRVTPSSESRCNDEVFQLAVDLPGVDRSDVDVTLEGDLLVIIAMRKPECDGKPKREYQKRFALVEDEVDMDKIEANLNNGVLVVTVPKKKIETKLKRQIPIN